MFWKVHKTLRVDDVLCLLADINISFLTMLRRIQEYHHIVKQFILIRPEMYDLIWI